MKHALLAALALAYWVVVGHGHTWVFVALALAAIRNDARHSSIVTRIIPPLS